MKANLSETPLWRLRKMLEYEQAKFDKPQCAGQIPKIAKNCARLRQAIRNAKQREQKIGAA